MQKKKQLSQRYGGLKNLIIGFLMGLCAMLVVAAANNSHSTGRYQCCSAGDESLSVFVIDTDTGQTWRLGRADYYDYGTPQAPKSVRRSVVPMSE
jgi:hypothetical protein